MSAAPNLLSTELHYIGILGMLYLFETRLFMYNICWTDIFGFEVYEENQFEQLCINFCNEKIQAMFNTRIFEAEIARLVEEGIPVDGITYKSCTECLSLLEGETGIFKLTDQYCYLNKQTSSDDVLLLDLMDKTHANSNSGYVARNSKSAVKYSGMRSDTFVVKHFAGDALYSISGFISSNADKVENDVLDMLFACQNDLIHHIFEADDIINRSVDEEKKKKNEVKKNTISVDKYPVPKMYKTKPGQITRYF